MADLSTIYTAFNDPQLRARIDATVWAESFYRQDTSDFARQVVRSYQTQFTAFYWRVAIDYAAAYETAARNGRGAPGFDTDVITDGNIAAAVGAAWPVDPEPLAQ